MDRGLDSQAPVPPRGSTHPVEEGRGRRDLGRGFKEMVESTLPVDKLFSVKDSTPNIPILNPYHLVC